MDAIENKSCRASIAGPVFFAPRWVSSRCAEIRVLWRLGGFLNRNWFPFAPSSLLIIKTLPLKKRYENQLKNCKCSNNSLDTALDRPSNRLLPEQCIRTEIKSFFRSQQFFGTLYTKIVPSSPIRNKLCLIYINELWYNWSSFGGGDDDGREAGLMSFCNQVSFGPRLTLLTSRSQILYNQSHFTLWNNLCSTCSI